MMGRWFFAIIMLIVGLMYIGLAFMATTQGTTDIVNKATGAVLFGVVGVAAAVAAFSLLREKRR